MMALFTQPQAQTVQNIAMNRCVQAWRQWLKVDTLTFGASPIGGKHQAATTHGARTASCAGTCRTAGRSSGSTASPPKPYSSTSSLRMRGVTAARTALESRTDPHFYEAELQVEALTQRLRQHAETWCRGLQDESASVAHGIDICTGYVTAALNGAQFDRLFDQRADVAQETRRLAQEICEIAWARSPPARLARLRMVMGPNGREHADELFQQLTEFCASRIFLIGPARYAIPAHLRPSRGRVTLASRAIGDLQRDGSSSPTSAPNTPGEGSSGQ
ncbi:unnamed protein product, partial [Prorocentrum cordatum]